MDRKKKIKPTERDQRPRDVPTYLQWPINTFETEQFINLLETAAAPKRMRAMVGYNADIVTYWQQLGVEQKYIWNIFSSNNHGALASGLQSIIPGLPEFETLSQEIQMVPLQFGKYTIHYLLYSKVGIYGLLCINRISTRASQTHSNWNTVANYAQNDTIFLRFLRERLRLFQANHELSIPRTTRSFVIRNHQDVPFGAYIAEFIGPPVEELNLYIEEINGKQFTYLGYGAPLQPGHINPRDYTQNELYDVKQYSKKQIESLLDAFIILFWVTYGVRESGSAIFPAILNIDAGDFMGVLAPNGLRHLSLITTQGGLYNLLTPETFSNYLLTFETNARQIIRSSKGFIDSEVVNVIPFASLFSEAKIKARIDTIRQRLRKRV